MEIVRDCVQRIVFGGVGEARGRALFERVILALALEGQLGSHARGFSRRHSKVVSPSTVTKQLTPTFAAIWTGSLNIGDLVSPRLLS